MSQKYKEKVLAGCGFSNRKVESDYASKLMKKMGWSEGQGLGKKDDGQVDCLQVSRRTEHLGLGNDTSAGSDWNDLWWEKSYNNTLQNLVAINNQDIKSDEDTEIKLKKTKKRAVITQDDESSSSDESVVQVIKKRINKKTK